jgi:hypothetical protein
VAIGNTAPTLDTGGSPKLPDIIAGSPPGTGALVRTLLGTAVTDPDRSLLRGIAVTATDTANGRWEYSLGLNKWVAIGPVSAGAALLLPDTARLRFVPFSATFTGTATIGYKAGDRSAGIIGDRIDTTIALNSFSVDVEEATVTAKAG